MWDSQAFRALGELESPHFSHLCVSPSVHPMKTFSLLARCQVLAAGNIRMKKIFTHKELIAYWGDSYEAHN